MKQRKWGSSAGQLCSLEAVLCPGHSELGLSAWSLCLVVIKAVFQSCRVFGLWRR